MLNTQTIQNTASGQLKAENFNASVQIIIASLSGIRDALVAWKLLNDRLTGEAAEFRGNLLTLVIDNLQDLVIGPLEEVRYK